MIFFWWEKGEIDQIQTEVVKRTLFSKKLLVDTCPFMERSHWYPCFGLLVSSLVGFKAKVSSLICTWQRCPWCTFSYSVGLSCHQLSVVKTFHWKIPHRSVVNYFTPFGMKQIWTKLLNYVLITALLTLGWDIRLKLPEASVFIVQQNLRIFNWAKKWKALWSSVWSEIL